MSRARKHRTRRFRAPGASYGFKVIGEKHMPLRDFYHALLHMPWSVTFALIAGTFLVANALFALVFLVVGGVAHAQPNSFLDAFFFSVQTMGTIGYGVLSPDTPGANFVVVAESITGLTLTALATGLVFAKFSRSTARIIVSRHAVISPMNNVPTLMFRMSNQRGNQIVGAQIRATMARTEITAEGGTFYRTIDLKLQRDHILSLSRSWVVLHTIDETSPLYGETPESIAAKEVELQVLVVGLDDISMQTVHSSHRYFAHQILWGHRLVDVVSEDADGDVVLDLTKFHDTEPTAPTPTFPYPV
ncbi:MAG TPA: ion channel [Polyangia bacterium]|nr:ion channel [Polyangia bacterium]